MSLLNVRSVRRQIILVAIYHVKMAQMGENVTVSAVLTDVPKLFCSRDFAQECFQVAEL